MSNLLRFIKLYHFLLLFVLIESLSIYMLFKNNDFHNYKLFMHSQENVSKINHCYKNIISYFRLKDVNEYLSDENAKLHSLLSKKSQNIDINYNNDYIYRSAQVINNSVYKRNNYLTINKGKFQGIQKGMGVITENGIVGIVYSVSENYSLVLSILHKKSAISVKLKKQRNSGFLKWNGFNYQEGQILDIPEHVGVKIGDTICSSGYGTIFPKDINIGSIISWGKDKKNGKYMLKVGFFEDLNALDFVYVVSSFQKKEISNLERKADE